MVHIVESLMEVSYPLLRTRSKAEMDWRIVNLSKNNCEKQIKS